ncbi:hypothetical protein AXG93_1420s1090 [Marchantia polymorpha subsp. ruderalis]|nr:hypothetical protein AXG93_1420s1090 [Marchantia polymorpha subsp. ruderalis]
MNICMPVLFVLIAAAPAHAALTSNFYENTCPSVQRIVQQIVAGAIANETRMGASLLRLHFHDCFVNGCDGSVLLDDTATLIGEKTATPNLDSLRGFDVVDTIKASVEAACPNTVSCADILAIAARDSVFQLGGPSWSVLLGRRDSLTASKENANTFLPSPFSDVATLRDKFAAVGLTTDEDLVSLSGGHTFGKARCGAFSPRIGGDPPDTTIDPDFNSTLNSICAAGANTTVDLDQTTPTTFDGGYYSNLLINRGLLSSDQALESEGGSTADLVSLYASTQSSFFTAFVNSMINMGDISPLEGTDGEIRVNCRVVNPTVAAM